jgi:hypothetical protein
VRLPSATHLVERLIHVDCLGLHLRDSVDGNQKLRLAETQEAAGRDAQEAHFVLAIVDEQIVNVPDVLACFVQHSAIPHVRSWIGRHQRVAVDAVQRCSVICRRHGAVLH